MNQYLCIIARWPHRILDVSGRYVTSDRRHIRTRHSDLSPFLLVAIFQLLWGRYLLRLSCVLIGRRPASPLVGRNWSQSAVNLPFKHPNVDFPLRIQRTSWSNCLSRWESVDLDGDASLRDVGAAGNRKKRNCKKIVQANKCRIYDTWSMIILHIIFSNPLIYPSTGCGIYSITIGNLVHHKFPFFTLIQS